MERLAWLEIIDQHGDVATRHPIYAWPVKVGRAYHNDVVLDDPFIAQDHLQIDQIDTGDYQITDLGSINGLALHSRKGKQTQATATTDEIVSIGKTRFRLRPVGYAVPTEKRLPHRVPIWSSLALLIGLMVLLAERIFVQWIHYNSETSYNRFASNILDQVPQLLEWIAVWVLLGRLLTGKMSWIGHAIIATLGGGLYFLLDDLSGYVGFAMNSNVVEGILIRYVSPAILMLLLYLHMRHASRMSRIRLGSIMMLLLVFSIGISTLREQWILEEMLGSMPYTRTIGPTEILLTKGKSIDAFMDENNQLKSKLDK